MSQIDENIKRINCEIPEGVTLIAVTKHRSIQEIQKAVECGVFDLGENRVQELMEKYEHFDSRIRWHLIGHLQKNKVKYIVGKVHLIHSVDSIALAEEIDRQSRKQELVTDILIQVNVSGEESKFGISPEETESVMDTLSGFRNIRVLGLMTIAPNVDNLEALKQIFTETYQIYDKIKKNEKRYLNIRMNYLSMGMTNDYMTAIESGSNMVRIGTGIFG
ncbi:MAG: YggS family pyridoxal phosphate-dependent enzyme [Eubacteriaceae bacterium]|nr:YggS family pyridoxal phosphate-dependent enzyme [Eubacteriaceae bacterium]